MEDDLGPAIANPRFMRNSQARQIMRELTPQEREIVKYHQGTLANGTVGRDSGGRPVTVYSNTVLVPEGRFAGHYATVPGWFDGAMHDNDDEIYRKWAPEIQSGKWPIYRDPYVGDARAKVIHQIMDSK
jgi:hypothetical protein